MKNPISRIVQSPYFFTFLLVLALVGFFLYARYSSAQFFIFLTGSLTLIIGYLISSYISLNNSQALLALEYSECEEQLNLLEVQILRERQSNCALQGKINNYSLLKDLTEKLCLSFKIADTSLLLASEINTIYRDEQMTAIVYLYKAAAGDLALLASYRQQGPLNLKAKTGDMFDQWVIKHSKPLLVEDTRADFRFNPESGHNEDDRVVRSMIVVPVAVDQKMLGLLRVDSSKEHHFTTEDLRFLNTVGNIGAVALENAQLYERVEDLAIRDSLTGLYLRRHLLERMTMEVGRHLRSKSEFAFLMIDLDHFKKYNDRFGHMAGDIVLKMIATILTDMFIAPGEIVCRYGGEEFCVLLPDCSKARAGQLAEEVRKRIETRTVILRREKTRITVSIGVAAYPVDAESKEDLVQKADAALYEAKAYGRNQVVFASAKGAS